MKKLIALLLLLVMVVGMFAACAPSECEVCGATGVSTEKVTIEGDSAWCCEDCAALAKLGAALMGLE